MIISIGGTSGDTTFRIIFKSKIHSLKTIITNKKRIMMKKTISMEVINSKCAGIDVGSRSHFVAIGQQDDQVCEYGVYAQDLDLLCKWFVRENIESVAMESTRNYW